MWGQQFKESDEQGYYVVLMIQPTLTAHCNLHKKMELGYDKQKDYSVNSIVPVHTPHFMHCSTPEIRLKMQWSLQFEKSVTIIPSNDLKKLKHCLLLCPWLVNLIIMYFNRRGEFPYFQLLP